MTDRDHSTQVDVLLAIYNGENFLREMLVSLRSQIGVEINLLIGDDGSSDDSLVILEEFKNDFNSFHLYKYSRLGTAQNFIRLLGESSAEFVAFADQDDVWDELKLVTSVNELRTKTKEDESALYIAPTRILNSSKVLKPLNYPFPIDFYSNRAQGCSFVLNKELVKQILDASNLGIEHLDWFTFLYAKYFGKIIIAEKSNMSYRIHGSNSVGSSGIRGALTRLCDPQEAKARRRIIEKQMNDFADLFREKERGVLIKKIHHQQELFKNFSFNHYLKFLGLTTLFRFPAKSIYFGVLIMLSNNRFGHEYLSNQNQSRGAQEV